MTETNPYLLGAAIYFGGLSLLLTAWSLLMWWEHKQWRASHWLRRRKRP